MTIQSSTSLTAGATNWSNALSSAVEKADTTGTNSGATAATTTAAATPAASTTTTGSAQGGHHHHHHHGGGGGSSPANSTSGATTSTSGTGQTGISIGVTVPSFASSLLSTLGLTSGSSTSVSAPGAPDTNGQSQPAGKGATTTIYL
jgi:hypothetical protein